MRTLVALSVVVLLGSAGFVRGDDCPAPLGLKRLTRWQSASGCCQFRTPAGTPDRIEHLQKAAEHLRAAGLDDEADRIAERARREKRRLDERVLVRKLAELERLEAEVDELRRALARSASSPAGQPRNQAEAKLLRSSAPQELQVEIRLKVIEIASGKLEALGIESAAASCPQCIKIRAIKSFPNLGGQLPLKFRTVEFDGLCDHCPEHVKSKDHPIATVIDDVETLAKRIAELCAKDLARVLAAPILRTTSGCPANISCGGEFPIPVREAGGRMGVEFREHGFHLQAVPTILDDGRLRLELSPEIAECDFKHAVTVGGVRVPGLTTRRLNAQLEMNAGETVLLGRLASGDAERELIILVTADTIEEPAPVVPAAVPPHAVPQPLMLPAPPLPVAPVRTR